MKIKPEHYEVLRDALIKNRDKIAAHRQYLLSPQNPRQPKDVEMRLRWDLLWAAGISQWLSDTISPYANDNHIDTALRKIMSEIEKWN